MIQPLQRQKKHSLKLIFIRRNKIKAILFDIDGTILKCNGAGKRSLMLASMETFGTIGKMEDTNFQGRTDLNIIFDSFLSTGLSEAIINEKLNILKERYFTHLEKMLKEFNVTLMPGIPELLDSLSADKNIILGLLTGNFSRGGQLKLSTFNLNKYFKIGVFADDTAIRNEMPAIANKKINDQFGISLDKREMIIIGDTIHDIECAHNYGALSVAVGTGWTETDELLSKKPDIYFDDLSDTGEVIKALLKQV